VKRRCVSAGVTPARQAGTFQPEGIGAVSGGNDTAEASGVESPTGTGQGCRPSYP
jgi:hypothetical protein